jgi:hypothetical protein
MKALHAVRLLSFLGAIHAQTTPTYISGPGLYAIDSCPKLACGGCPNGQYRAGCVGINTGSCSNCVNTLPANAEFVGPSYSPTCAFQCNTGFGLSNGACAISNCATCAAGLYTTGCTASNAGSCAQCETCSPSLGYYRSGCTGINAGSCGACETCPGGKYRSGCTGTNAGTCEACANTLPANAAWGASSSSSTCAFVCTTGHVLSNGACVPTSICTICSAGSYNSGCTATIAGTCETCTTCASGLYKSGCTGTNAGTCETCTNTLPANAAWGASSSSSTCAFVCTTGHVLSGTACVPTSSCTICSAGFYNSGCTATIAGSCVTCATCPAGKYSLGCSGTNAGTCETCTTCAAGSYKSGCTGTNAGTCETCTTCASGSYKSGCTGPNAGTCETCATCAAGSYKSGCTGPNAGTCETCATCAVGSYKSGCTGTNAGTCETCASCAAGKYSLNCAGTNAGTCPSCTNTLPANAEFVAPSTSATCAWKCKTGYDLSGVTCVFGSTSVYSVSASIRLPLTTEAVSQNLPAIARTFASLGGCNGCSIPTLVTAAAIVCTNCKVFITISAAPSRRLLAASSIVSVTIVQTNAKADADATVTKLGSAATINTALAAQGVAAEASVESSPVLGVVVPTPAPPPPAPPPPVTTPAPSSSSSNAGVIGGAVGGTLVLLIGVGVGLYFMLRQPPPAVAAPPPGRTLAHFTSGRRPTPNTHIYSDLFTLPRQPSMQLAGQRPRFEGHPAPRQQHPQQYPLYMHQQPWRPGTPPVQPQRPRFYSAPVSNSQMGRAQY